MPVKPSESRALIPEANTPICPKVIRLFIEHPTITDRIVSDIWNEDGTVTDAFKAAIGLTVGGLAAPTNVVATDGVGTSVTITWSPVTGAQSYKVFRGLTNDSSAATQIGSPSAETLVDSSGTSGQVYWYFVKATNAGGDSSFSSGDSGYWGALSGTPIHYDSSQNVTVPAGWNTIAVMVYGDGGGGGGGSFPNTWVPSGVAYGGGGGGSGGKRTVTGIVVAVGQIIGLQIGTGGSAGSTATSGTSGQGTSVANLTTTAAIAAASGGSAGGGGGINSAGSAGAGGAGATTTGNVGSAGTVGTGGAGGTGVDGYGGGGAGGNTSASGTVGTRGHVVITPNG